MIDHSGVSVSQFQRSKEFYKQALAPLGYALIMELPAAVTGRSPVAGFGERGKPDFWINEGQANTPRIHIAFAAVSRAQVDEFYRAAIAAGATDNGAPGLRARYHANYYGGFVLDPDGHNIEAVCHQPE